jgi:hypothetical protein
MNESAKRTRERALFVYLFWLRIGMTMEVKLFFWWIQFYNLFILMEYRNNG